MESNALAETFELNTEDLIKAAIENGEGTIASNGALSLETGSRTGRSPNDRFIVEEDSTSHLIDWVKLIGRLMRISFHFFGIKLMLILQKKIATYQKFTLERMQIITSL